MRFFKIGDITKWRSYDGSDITCPAGKHTIKVLGNGLFSVYFGDTLVGCGNNEVIQVTFSGSAGTLKITASKGTNILLSFEEGAGIITGEFEEENFVSLEPKRNYSPEIYRMELMMRQNQLNMQAQLQAERARVEQLLRASTEAAEAVIEPAATPLAEDG